MFFSGLGICVDMLIQYNLTNVLPEAKTSSTKFLQSQLVRCTPACEIDKDKAVMILGIDTSRVW